MCSSHVLFSMRLRLSSCLELYSLWHEHNFLDEETSRHLEFRSCFLNFFNCNYGEKELNSHFIYFSSLFQTLNQMASTADKALEFSRRSTSLRSDTHATNSKVVTKTIDVIGRLDIFSKHLERLGRDSFLPRDHSREYSSRRTCPENDAPGAGLHHTVNAITQPLAFFSR